ncbi:MAG: GGDEF domain-containing protein, partial [Cellulomonadaceae bacterium]|nr:GGDEF domain-containing protein [Cellulomonadaceae bacterium]
HAAGTPLAAMMIDLDHFKSINDALGHAVGDEVLIGVAQELASSVRAADELVRFGGEEFLALLPGLAPADAHRRAEELRRRLGGLHLGPVGEPVRVTASIGLAHLAPGQSPDALLRAADDALYAAKAAGRDRVVAAPRPDGGSREAPRLLRR